MRQNLRPVIFLLLILITLGFTSNREGRIDFRPAQLELRTSINGGKSAIYLNEPVVLTVEVENISTAPIITIIPSSASGMNYPYIEWTAPDLSAYAFAGGVTEIYTRKLLPGESYRSIFDISCFSIEKDAYLDYLNNKLRQGQLIQYCKQWGFDQIGEYEIKVDFRNTEGNIIVSAEPLRFSILPITEDEMNVLYKFKSPEIAELIASTNETHGADYEKALLILKELSNAENLGRLKPYVYYLLGKCILGIQEKLTLRMNFNRVAQQLRNEGKDELYIPQYIESLPEFQEARRQKNNNLIEATLCFEFVEQNYPDFPLQQKVRYALYDECYKELMAKNPEIREKARGLMKKMLEENYGDNIKSQLNDLIRQNRRILQSQ